MSLLIDLTAEEVILYTSSTTFTKIDNTITFCFHAGSIGIGSIPFGVTPAKVEVETKQPKAN